MAPNPDDADHDDPTQSPGAAVEHAGPGDDDGDDDLAEPSEPA